MKKILAILLTVSMITGMASFGAMAEESTEGGKEKLVIAACMQGNQSGFVQYMTSGMWEYQKNNAPEVDLQVVCAYEASSKQRRK